MFETEVRLSSISLVQKFVTFANEFRCEIDLTTDGNRYVVDAKSIMGVFSLDLSCMVTVIMHTTNEEDILRMRKFIANMEN